MNKDLLIKEEMEKFDEMVKPYIFQSLDAVKEWRPKVVEDHVKIILDIRIKPLLQQALSKIYDEGDKDGFTRGHQVGWDSKGFNEDFSRG